MPIEDFSKDSDHYFSQCKCEIRPHCLSNPLELKLALSLLASPNLGHSHILYMRQDGPDRIYLGHIAT